MIELKLNLENKSETSKKTNSTCSSRSSNTDNEEEEEGEENTDNELESCSNSNMSDYSSNDKPLDWIKAKYMIFQSILFVGKIRKYIRFFIRGRK